MYMRAGMRVARRIPGGRDVYACESCRQRTVPCINNCGAGIVARGVMMWEEWLMSKSAPCFTGGAHTRVRMCRLAR